MTSPFRSSNGGIPEKRQAGEGRRAVRARPARLVYVCLRCGWLRDPAPSCTGNKWEMEGVLVPARDRDSNLYVCLCVCQTTLYPDRTRRTRRPKTSWTSTGTSNAPAPAREAPPPRTTARVSARTPQCIHSHTRRHTHHTRTCAKNTGAASSVWLLRNVILTVLRWCVVCSSFSIALNCILSCSNNSFCNGVLYNVCWLFCVCAFVCAEACGGEGESVHDSPREEVLQNISTDDLPDSASQTAQPQDSKFSFRYAVCLCVPFVCLRGGACESSG